MKGEDVKRLIEVLLKHGVHLGTTAAIVADLAKQDADRART